MVTWLGTDTADDLRNPDGIPNSLLTGGPVPYPRPFVGTDGLPQGFADEVAPLIVALDRARVRYDITTDLDLADSADPRASDRPGVLLAGTHRWVSRPMARRLRKYVSDGGRVALFGTRQLKAGVSIGATRLTSPTPPGPADAFGERLAAPRRLTKGPDGKPERIDTVVDDPDTLTVFTGFDGQFDAPFETVEELLSPGRGQVVAGLGDVVTEEEAAALEAQEKPVPDQHPAFSVVKFGKGYVFRTGIDGWVDRLAAGDPEVAQITRNVLDLLRRVNPRPRSVGG
jgi:hypothetical protein